MQRGAPIAGEEEARHSLSFAGELVLTNVDSFSTSLAAVAVEAVGTQRRSDPSVWSSVSTVVGIKVWAGHLAAATRSAALVAFAFGAIALWDGGEQPGPRGVVIGLAAAAAVAAWTPSTDSRRS